MSGECRWRKAGAIAAPSALFELLPKRAWGGEFSGRRRVAKRERDEFGISKHSPTGHPPVRTGHIGVLLVNLGTPEATDRASMRRYLKQFLSDRRVIETNRVLWWFILNGIILNTRPKKSGHAYAKIWNRELNESPLKTITRSQAEKVAAAFDAAPTVEIDWGMRYGMPPVGERLQDLKTKGCDRILIFPLYPQYSAATTASVMDAVCDALTSMRWQPAIRTVPSYHDHPAYIDALAESLSTHLKSLAWTPDLILASFHGLPQEYFDKGDPYHCHCQKTARLLSEQLDIRTDIAFQSRFGRAKWLEPGTDKVLAAYPGQGVERIAIAAPGFSADCVETVEELGIRGRETFLGAGGTHFARLDCLNDSPEGMTMLDALVRRELAGWLPQP